MKMQQVSDNCFAVLNEKNRVCAANSGLINCAGGVVIDTQSDLAHARQMIDIVSANNDAVPAVRPAVSAERGKGRSFMRSSFEVRPTR